MITEIELPWKTGSWRARLGAVVRDLDGLPGALAPGGFGDGAGFPVRIPREWLGRPDPDGALGRQVLPAREEQNDVPGFGRDPLGEVAGPTQDGVVRKYRGRVLLLVTGACAVHCRYCFRRHFPYGDHELDDSTLERALALIAGDCDLEEVVLSGGDPLTLNDERLASIVKRLEGIPHLRRLRLHTRLPIAIPQRVDAGLLEWLGTGRLRRLVVVHVNHASEVDRDVRIALRALAKAGLTVLNQSVLLAGVNDDVERLVELSRVLDDCGVLPYYLHLLDPVAGAAHFEVGEDRARRIWTELTARLPGYLVPRLVRESPGAPAKIVLAPAR